MATTPTFTSTPRARGAQPGPSTSSTSMPKIALGVLFVAAILLVSLNASPERILAALDWMASHRRESVAVFLVGYVMGVVLMLPAMLLAMSSGAIFGVAFGFLISYVGSNIGNALAFWAGRYIFRDAVVAYLTKKYPKWTVLDQALSKEGFGFKLIVLLRLSPIAPWNLLNWALSVVSVSNKTYLAASAISIVPYILLFVYMGAMAANLAEIASGEAKLDGRWTLVAALGGGVAVAGVVYYINKVSRKAMETMTDGEVSELLGEVDGDGEADGEGAGNGASVGLSGMIGSSAVLDRRRVNEAEIEMT
jgi:uncharacterized membrane protein YdjX (TVP38/TMEM64 family)